MNRLLFGDNLGWLRDTREFPDASVDLEYLDPPFNSNADYNVLFREASGQASQAQFHAFTDTWTWADAADLYNQFIDSCPNVAVTEMMEAFHSFLKNSPMMAYLAMMAPRLVELHRVLKPTGSLYLHCDPTASHYLKLLLDAIFGAENFRNEIIWKRTTAHSNVYRNYGDITDSIFFYVKSDAYTWNQVYRKVEDIEAAFPNVDSKGRRWRSENMRNPGVRPNLHYPYTATNGVTYQPHPTQDAAQLHSHLSVADFLAHSIAARYALAACALSAPDSPEQWRRLRELCADAVQLRRGDQAAERLRLDRDRLARHHQPAEEEVAEYFHHWARNPKVRDWICCDSLSPEERERRLREIFGLSPTDTANPAAQSHAATNADGPQSN